MRALFSVFTPLCPGCHEHSKGGDLCEVCESYLEPNLTPCSLCGEPNTPTGLCGQCSAQKPAWDASEMPWLFTGLTRFLIHQFKYHRQSSAGIALLNAQPPRSGQAFDAIAAVPMFASKEIARGYNHAALLAQHLAKLKGKPIFTGLQRVTDTPMLADLSKSERAVALKHAFRVKKRPPPRLLLVDDVLTSGATCTEICRQLKQAGCQHLTIWALARTPKKD